ncbi:MAG: hypothetical protein L6Q78_00570 [Bacteroidia bacterium]|nr:hypothetical protein [Bacteroidia bacterium]
MIKQFKKYLFLFLGLILVNALEAQRSIQLRDEMGKPMKIQASLFINGEFAGQSNTNGLITLPEYASGKDLCIRHMAYQDTCFSWPENFSQLDIPFKPKTYALREVSIQSKRRNRQKMLGCYTCKEQGNFYGTPGTILGLEIPNTLKKRGKLKSLDIFLSALGNPRTPFRIRLYTPAQGKDSLIPLEVQLPEVSFETRGNEWVGFELDTFQIPFPKEGLVVAMEWLEISEAYPHSHKYRIEGQAAQIDYYGQVMGGSTYLRGEHALKIKPDNSFSRLQKEDWGRTYFNPMIRIEISYY